MLAVCTHNTCISCGACHVPDYPRSQPLCLAQRWEIAFTCANLVGFMVGFSDGLLVLSQGDQYNWFPLTDEGLFLVENWLGLMSTSRHQYDSF